MKLSKLVYQCVKNVIYFDDTSFSYEAFVHGDFDNNVDYANNINNVFAPINEAIARLSDLERIPYRVEECTIVEDIIKLNECDYPVKEVISVAQGSYRGFVKLIHRPFGLGNIYVYDYNPYARTFIEYKEDIPMFNSTYYSYTNSDYLSFDEKDTELRDYGISDSMCNYIIEYVMGRLYEATSAEIANMHITRAEQYFSGIKSVTSAFVQKVVRNTYAVGE